MTTSLLRAQHGSAINPADPGLVDAVATRLSDLARDGESFTTPDVNETQWAQAFAARALDWTGRRVRKARGAAWQECHAMTARIVAQDPARYRHVFGYARDGDSHWRTHSWAHDTQTGDLIEGTPLVRSRYVGVELTPDEALDFALDFA